MTTAKIRAIIRERFQQKWIAKHIGSDYAHLNQVIKGRRPMTEELKTKLENAIRDAKNANISTPHKAEME